MSACQEDKSKQAKLMREKKNIRVDPEDRIRFQVYCGKQPNKTILVWNEEMRM